MRKHFAGDVCGDLNRDRRARTEGQEAKRLLRVGVRHGWGAAPINPSGGRIEMSNADFARNTPGSYGV